MSKRVLNRHWPWITACWIAYTAGMAFLWWLLRGFSKDFGMGVAVGGAAMSLIVLLAVGWSRGEMRREEPEQ